jgi:hypothetical protein
VAQAHQLMLAAEKILSTRKDFSLTELIRKVMSVPGTNKFTPEMIRQGNIVAEYPTRDCYEIMHTYYRPKMQIYFDLLRPKLAALAGSPAARPSVTMDEFQRAFQDKFFIPAWGGGPLTPDKAHSGRRSVHIQNGGGTPPLSLVVKELGEDLALQAWVYPVSQSGNGKLVYSVSGFNAQGEQVVSLAYVLIGKEDYWSYQNQKVEQYQGSNLPCYFVTRVLNLPLNAWSSFKMDSVAQDLEKQFPEAKWTGLGIVKCQLSVVGWQAGGTVEGYLDDVAVKQLAPVHSAQSRPLAVIESRFESDPGPRLNRWILNDQTVPESERFRGTTVQAIRAALEGVGNYPTDPQEPFPSQEIKPASGGEGTGEGVRSKPE